MNQFGVLKPAFQAIVTEVPRTFTPAPTESTESERSNDIVDWQGLRVKKLVGEGEKSAAGLGDESGVLVMEGQGNLSRGDVILEINGAVVDTVVDLQRMSNKHKGQAVQLKVWRGSARTETLILK